MSDDIFVDKIKEISGDIEVKNSVKNAGPIIIGKRDSMNEKVEEIINLIKESQSVVISAKGNNIGKMVGIVEIAKTKVEIDQYNKLIKQQIEQHPKTGEVIDKGLENKKFLVPILICYLVPKGGNVDLTWTKQ